MVNVYLMGKKYEVPEGLTIMGAMEYAGYKLLRGCGCRNGFCGACATIYRIKGERELHAVLACQTTVENDMYVATLPFFPLEKQVYDINEVKHDAQIMMQLDPENVWAGEKKYLVTDVTGSAADVLAVYTGAMTTDHDGAVL